MRNRLFAAVLLAFVLLFYLPAPRAAASQLSYYRMLNLDGLIRARMQAGSDDSGAGRHATLIRGRGSLDSDARYYLGGDVMDILNRNSWSGDPGSLQGLQIATALRQPEQAGVSGPQVFAVSVKANRGETGHLNQEITVGTEAEYFAIGQEAGTTGGTLKRHIDLICPVSGEYIFEDTLIKGSAETVDLLNQVDGAALPLLQFLPVSGSGEGPEDDDEEDDLAIFFAGRLPDLEVAPGTALDDIDFPETADLVLGPVTIRDLVIEWPGRESDPPYDSEQPGDYTFRGLLVFPPGIISPEAINVTFTVRVAAEIPVEPAETEDQKPAEPAAGPTADLFGASDGATEGGAEPSDHLEDPVHGGENGVNEQADE